jgi:hypothetical protein
MDYDPRGSNEEFTDNAFVLQDETDPTKKLVFQLGDIPSGETRIISVLRDTTLGQSPTALSAVTGTVTIPMGGANDRFKHDADGDANNLTISGAREGAMVDIQIRDGDAITWDASWIWQTTEPTSYPANGLGFIHLEARENEAQDGYEIHAWDLGSIDWSA